MPKFAAIMHFTALSPLSMISFAFVVFVFFFVKSFIVFTITTLFLKNRVAADIKKMCCELKEVNSFKFFLAYKGALMVNDEQLCAGFDLCSKIGAVAQVHAGI